jgi:excisionase family DNA binding protein
MAIEIFTPDELGELIRLSANRVVALARRGEIPFLTIDGHIRFDARDVEDWLQSRRSDAPTMPPRMVQAAGQSGSRNQEECP